MANARVRFFTIQDEWEVATLQKYSVPLSIAYPSRHIFAAVTELHAGVL